MIARSWDGLTAEADADRYQEYLRETGLKDLGRTSGNRGVFLLRRREGGKTRFRVMSLWDSLDAIRAFAGDDVKRARYYPEDERYLEELSPQVEHFEVVASGDGRPAVGEAAVLARELETLARGENWHGPTFHDLLDGTTAGAAAARPIADAHTIWELVLHVAAWTDVFRRRLEGTAVEEPEAGDYPAPPSPTPEAWDDARRKLFEAHERLVARVAGLSDAALARPVPGRPFDARFQVRAAIRHTVYHSGQIALLRKAG